MMFGRGLLIRTGFIAKIDQPRTSDQGSVCVRQCRPSARTSTDIVRAFRVIVTNRSPYKMASQA